MCDKDRQDLLNTLEATISRERQENERLRNKLNKDSQNFQIECQKAEIELWRDKYKQILDALKHAVDEIVRLSKSTGGDEEALETVTRLGAVIDEGMKRSEI